MNASQGVNGDDRVVVGIVTFPANKKHNRLARLNANVTTNAVPLFKMQVAFDYGTTSNDIYPYLSSHQRQSTSSVC
jgi:hypothetical protein